jgi:hypothetical protein
MQRLLIAVSLSIICVSAANAVPSNPPTCDDYDVGLELHRLFNSKSPSAFGSIVMMNATRQRSINGDVRACSAELVLNRSWMKSSRVYVEWTLTAIGTGWALTLTHMEDL